MNAESGFEEAARTFVESLPLSWLDDIFGLKCCEGDEFEWSTVIELRQRVADLEDECRKLAEAARWPRRSAG